MIIYFYYYFNKYYKENKMNNILNTHAIDYFILSYENIQPISKPGFKSYLKKFQRICSVF